MDYRVLGYLLLVICSVTMVFAQAGKGYKAMAEKGYRAFWVDLYHGEPVKFKSMVDDLAAVDVIYLGERHTLQRHHDLHEEIVKALAKRGKKVILGLEQMESFLQRKLDKYNKDEISFEELAQKTDWKKRWSNFEDYRGLIEAAKESGGHIIALNAKKELVRKIGRKGIKSISTEDRRKLPHFTKMDNDWHKKLVTLKVQVHAAMKPEMLNSIYEAQTVRDENMASMTARALRKKKADEIVVVVCGSGHCNYGLGIPQRVRRRLPKHKERIVHFTESGFLELSEAMKKHAKDIKISHEQLRFLQGPIADYMHCHEQKRK